MVSHEVPGIFSISDYVAMIKDGVIAAAGSCEDFRRVQDPEVREFISVGGTVPLD
jgi:phospholipid/cholesterol/gamma-HCH transport system ATP-binding protein